MDQAQIDADTAALASAQSTDDAAKAALSTADINLATATATLAADQAQFAIDQASPALSLVDKIEDLVKGVESELDTDFHSAFDSLIAQARNLFSTPAASAPAATSTDGGAQASGDTQAATLA